MVDGGWGFSEGGGLVWYFWNLLLVFGVEEIIWLEFCERIGWLLRSWFGGWYFVELGWNFGVVGVEFWWGGYNGFGDGGKWWYVYGVYGVVWKFLEFGV